ncbi:MAG: hypothetical protein ACOC9J_05235 [Persicimonas sp.]
MNPERNSQDDAVPEPDTPLGQKGSVPASVGFFDALQNIPKVLAHAWKSRVLWVFGLVVVGQIMLAVASVVAKQALSFDSISQFAQNQVQTAQTNVMIYSIVVWVLWTLSLLAMTSLFGPMRKALAVPPSTGRGVGWSLKEALWASPKLVLFGFIALLISTPPAVILALIAPLAVLILVLPALLIGFLLAPAPWFIAGGSGIISSIKKSLSLVRQNLLCFIGFFFLTMFIYLSCGCAGSLAAIIPILGEVISATVMILCTAFTWLLYVSVLSTLEAARGDLMLE